ncbi:hypothetical protein [Acetobacter musti]|uniref:hypothetical protein n=1 Tax=Acetobacter musti TaxID=864732 RepID=UPI001F54DF02|nr:hypothetical protein [Acetobacter musti]
MSIFSDRFMMIWTRQLRVIGDRKSMNGYVVARPDDDPLLLRDGPIQTDASFEDHLLGVRGCDYIWRVSENLAERAGTLRIPDGDDPVFCTFPRSTLTAGGTLCFTPGEFPMLPFFHFGTDGSCPLFGRQVVASGRARRIKELPQDETNGFADGGHGRGVPTILQSRHPSANDIHEHLVIDHGCGTVWELGRANRSGRSSSRGMPVAASNLMMCLSGIFSHLSTVV